MVRCARDPPIVEGLPRCLALVSFHDMETMGLALFILIAGITFFMPAKCRLPLLWLASFAALISMVAVTLFVIWINCHLDMFPVHPYIVGFCGAVALLLSVGIFIGLLVRYLSRKRVDS